MLMSFLNSLIRRIVFPNTYSSNAYISFLNRHGVRIGENTVIYSPNNTTIDIRKPHLISIGDYCKITKGVTVLAHDYSVSVLRKVYGEFIGGSLPVCIGDNCFIGMNTTILMGTQIGNNCIVGANSVVKGVFPDNVVIAGNPAKVVCTLEKFFQKNREQWVENAKKCAQAIYRNTGRKPTIHEMSDGYFWMYMPHTEDSIKEYPAFFELSADDLDQIKDDYLKTMPLFNSFEDFLEECDW